MILGFEDWLIENEERLCIRYAESGEDREMDFDLERSLDRDYEKYLKGAPNDTGTGKQHSVIL